VGQVSGYATYRELEARLAGSGSTDL